MTVSVFGQEGRSSSCLLSSMPRIKELFTRFILSLLGTCQCFGKERLRKGRQVQPPSLTLMT